MSTVSTDVPRPTDSDGRGLLVVEAGGALYGFDRGAVREVVAMAPTTRLPGAPPHVLGILSLRGTVMTIIDLPRRVGGMALREAHASIVVIHGGGRMLGVAVDEVLDIQPVPIEGLDPAPVADSGALASGLGHFGGRVVIVIDANELVRQVLA